MPRTRVHNMETSPDGYAAGEHGYVSRNRRAARAAVHVFRWPGSMASIRRSPVTLDLCARVEQGHLAPRSW